MQILVNGKAKYAAAVVLRVSMIMGFIRGFEDFVADMIIERKNVVKLTDIVFDTEEEFMRKCTEEGFEVRCIADDRGVQTSLLISREMICGIFIPRYKNR